MENIYNAIKNDIKSHPNVTLSILGQVREWKRSQFVILSDIISEYLSTCVLLTSDRKLNLGVTISAITLQRFFENDYQVKTHNDLRFIKTLDKLCLFLGKHDLNNYIHDRVNLTEEIETHNDLKVESIEKDLIINFCKSQFDALMDLPKISINKISRFVYVESPLTERIRVAMEEKRKNNLVIITENNRSNYEIFGMTKISDDGKLKVIKTQEFWNLLFMDGDQNTYIANHLNTQFYFIKKFGEEWKIWDNFNPDYGQILKIN
ncbi:hypothetical protein [Kaistella jeonii]|uniref:Uncharacterized protein n=1 Tax=Kaistella jeonii TaxID=266749 RepID=A0A0C1D5G7_9FLAO|nr:hypothetical protein [Kaistella jeonii]KIA88995.1 hypothetical protein OA86_07905 [Kaistella jeonii]SFB97143.1 hypothetical protein SAMN05421876_104187 [Kaistella jeonii]VEI97212.1 Uncharacterised protein [Kaistella jeonii]